MEVILKSLTELFFLHDCVVIPRLGGFLANYQPAFFDTKNNLIVPPSKDFIFNRFLLHNDGLLAHQIATNSGISYNEALEIIDSFVTQLLIELKKNSKVDLTLIGALYYDQNNLLRYSSNNKNYLIASFGLPILKQLPKLNLALEDTTPVIQIKSSTQSADTIIPIEGYQKSSTKWWVAAAVLPLVFYAAWIPMKTDLFNQNGNFHYSDLNPFSYEKPTPLYSSLAPYITPIDSIKYETPINKESVSIPIESDILDNAFEDEMPPIETSKNTNVITNTGSYHLIGGCFSSEENANNFVADLISQGFSAQILDHSGGLFRVSVANFENNDAAKNHKNSLKNDHNIATWILKKTQK